MKLIPIRYSIFIILPSLCWPLAGRWCYTLSGNSRCSPRREVGWEPKYQFNNAIRTTIEWYRNNEKWWRSIKSGEYLKYYEQQYGAD